MQPQQFEIILEALSNSQELIEKSSFDSINQHDKVANLISELMNDMNHLMMKLDAMNYQLEELIALQKDSKCDEKMMNEFSQLLEEQNILQIETSQRLQCIIEAQELESEVIHDMELQIAEHREILNEACYIKE